MEKNFDIKKNVDNDILYCKDVWKSYSHDKEAMEELFNKILFKYIDKIEFIADGLRVISSYEDNNEMADMYRANVSTIITRLENFKNNNYSNVGLKDYYLRNESVKINLDRCINMSFNEVRKIIMELENVTLYERDEIIDKIDEIEEICLMRITRKERWELLRPYVIWTSGKGLNVAINILPLFLQMNQY